MIASILGSYGVMNAQRQFERSAERVAQGDDVDYVKETVEQTEARQAYSANIQTQRVADAMLRDMIDLLS